MIKIDAGNGSGRSSLHGDGHRKPQGAVPGTHPRSTASLFGHPLHPMLVPIPMVCFIGALLADFAYWRSANVQWSNFSIWLIAFGLIGAGLAAATGIIDYVGDPRIRAARPATPHMILNLSVFVIELINAFVHSRDGGPQSCRPA